MQKLDWLPLYVDKLLSSPAWQDMKDYQRGWYIQMLLRSARSERLGYLKLDGNLWRIAGAHSRAMWDQHSAAVMACFKSRQIDGTEWIYNQRLLSTMEEQDTKFLRGKRVGGSLPSKSPSKNSLNSKEEERTTTPDLPASTLARNVLEKCGMPVLVGNLRAVAAAIEAVALDEQSGIPGAHDWLLEKCLLAIAEGQEITKFWFEDGKYKYVGKPQLSKQIGRIKRSYDAVDRAFTEDGEGDADANEREVREGTDRPGSKLLEGNTRRAAAAGD
jgi:hypothetical protein